MLGIGLHSYGFMDQAFNTLQWFAILQILFILAAVQPLHHWLSGRHIAKEYNGTIACIVSVMMGIGVALHVTSMWVDRFSLLVSLLGIALVCAGLLLSFLPFGATGTTSKKTA